MPAASSECPDGDCSAAHAPSSSPITIEGTVIVLPARIEFDKSRVRATSEPMLRDLAAFVQKHPELLSVQIGVHSDKKGSSTFNLRITQERADAVVAFLVARGVNSSRLRAVGFGETAPLLHDDSARVELSISKKR